MFYMKYDFSAYLIFAFILRRLARSLHFLIFFERTQNGLCYFTNYPEMYWEFWLKSFNWRVPLKSWLSRYNRCWLPKSCQETCHNPISFRKCKRFQKVFCKISFIKCAANFLPVYPLPSITLWLNHPTVP